MMRVLHPGRLLRYAIYVALLGTAFISLYTLISLLTSNRQVNVVRPATHNDEMLNYLAEYMSVHYRLVDHQDYMSQSEIILTNTGSHDIKPGNWTMYIFYMSPIDVDLYNYGGNPNPWFRIYRVQGNLYRMTPTSNFQVIRPSEAVTVPLTSGSWIMAYTDLLPNWYVWSPGQEPRILRKTLEDANHQPEFVEPFTSANQLIRIEGDPFHPWTAADRYTKRKLRYMPDIGLPLIPTPLSVENIGDSHNYVTLDGDWGILALPELQSEADILKENLGLTVRDKRAGSKLIVMTIGNVHLPPGYHVPDSYQVQIDGNNENIKIVGQSPAGVFYGVQSLISIFNPLTRQVPSLIVTDAPRFEYRGLMMDLSRNFHSNLTEIKRVLKAMAMYKMNKLQLHLGDDEGWRLEIPGLPELTETGAFRCHDLNEQFCILPALGSGPFTNSSGSGYLSTRDYVELVKFAAKLHIEIIPEFDMPGHARAAIRSMERRYRNYIAQGDKGKATEFLLSDPKDRSMYMSGQFFTDNAINPCMESTYLFVEHIIVELQKMHKNFYPLKRFHFGGDEVPENAYMESPICQEYMASHPELLDTKDLKIHFIKRIAAIAARHNLGLQGWEDAFYGKEILPVSLHHGTPIVTNVWWNMWEAGIGHRANELANSGYKVVLSHATHLYFDHVQEPDPSERGLYWSIRYIDTKRVFGYIASDIYQNIDMRGLGDPWSKDEACAQVVNCVPLERPENVIGIQAQMWAETVRTRSHQNLMLFPRALALAERAWHKPSWELLEGISKQKAKEKDWSRFATLLGEKELKRLDGLDVHYRLPPPGVMKTTQGVRVLTEFPGLPVQYSINGGKTWQDWNTKVQLQGNVLFVSRSHDGKRQSRPVEVVL